MHASSENGLSSEPYLGFSENWKQEVTAQHGQESCNDLAGGVSVAV